MNLTAFFKFIGLKKPLNKIYVRPFIKKNFVKCKLNSQQLNCKIAICTMYTPEIAKYGQLTEMINRLYANQHDYDFFCFKKRLGSLSSTAHWDKLLVIKSILKKNDQTLRLYDYVLWIDADAYFNERQKRIEDLIDQTADFLVCDDEVDCLANTGIMIVKNTQWSRNFIDTWWKIGVTSKFANEKFHEQQILEGLYLYDLLGLRKKIRIFPSEHFNSSPKKIKHRKKNWDKTFIVHLMGLEQNTKLQILQKICGDYFINEKCKFS